MIETLVISQAMRAQIAREAQLAHPRECCGLIEGTREASRAVALAVHPMRNIAQQDDRFEIDPAAHIVLAKTLRGTGRAIVGCYHSHPEGRAEPSERDAAMAGETGFFWLIEAGILRGFVWTGEGFAEAALATSALA